MVQYDMYLANSYGMHVASMASCAEHCRGSRPPATPMTTVHDKTRHLPYYQVPPYIYTNHIYINSKYFTVYWYFEVNKEIYEREYEYHAP